MPHRLLVLALLCAPLAACRPSPPTTGTPADTAQTGPAPAGSAVGGAAALAQMQGVWQAVEDTAARVEVQGTAFVSRYTGEAPHGGTLAFVGTCGGRPADAAQRYFVLTEEDTPYCYFLQALSDSVMQLTYVADGQTLGYRRIGPASAAPDVPDAAPAPASAVSLDAEGLRFVNPITGAARPLAFGTPQAQTLAALTAALGAPRTTGTNAECGAGPLGFATWADGLSLAFARGAFAGWYVDGRAAEARRFTTMAGLGIGTTRAELNDAYEVRVGPTSLGTEFTVGEMGGLLTNATPEATVTDLWAGTTCMAR